MIDSYESGCIVIDGARYISDVIIFPDRVDASWWRKEGHDLDIADVESVIEERPEVLIVGTGVNGLMRVPDRTRDHIEAAGIELVIERTGKACQMYNEISKNSRTVAALHLTC